jgi:hypothetical protein
MKIYCIIGTILFASSCAHAATIINWINDANRKSHITAQELTPSLSTKTEVDHYPWCQDNTEIFDLLLPSGSSLSKKCNWVKKAKTQRCSFPNVKENCPKTCESCQCTNNKGRFLIESGYFEGLHKSCKWVDSQISTRCTISNAVKNCPLSCSQCNTSPSIAPSSVPTRTSHPSLAPTPVPSVTTEPSRQSITTHPTSSPTDSPTSMYSWCEDSNNKFKIKSISWIRGKKNCAWAGKKTKWFRCKIEEVQKNCPVVCNKCQCSNNKKRFKISKGKRKTCVWVGRKDTSQRCNELPNVKRNCPLSCGDCDIKFPSSVPTQAPSVEKFPTLRYTLVTDFELKRLVIPEDADQFEAMKSVLVSAFQSFLPEDSRIIGIEIDYAKERFNYRGKGEGKLTIERYFSCGSDDCSDTASKTEEYKEVTGYTFAQILTSGSLNKKIKEKAEEVGVFNNIKVGEIYAITGGSTEIIHPTAPPSTALSTSPTSIPTTFPTRNASQYPTVNSSDKPSVNISTVPSRTPTKAPTKSLTKSPTKILSQVPTSAPSKSLTLNPSTTPSLIPSTGPSSMPSTNTSLEPSQVPSKLPSQMPSLIPSQVLSKVPSEVPSQMQSQAPSLNPSSPPSTVESSTPSRLPSLMPSTLPSLSTIPSNDPTSFATSNPSAKKCPSDSLQPIDPGTPNPDSNFQLQLENMGGNNAVTRMDVLFQNAARRWERIITGDLPNVNKASDEEFDWFGTNFKRKKNIAIDDILIGYEARDIQPKNSDEPQIRLGFATPIYCREEDDNGDITPISGVILLEESVVKE